MLGSGVLFLLCGMIRDAKTSDVLPGAALSRARPRWAHPHTPRPAGLQLVSTHSPASPTTANAGGDGSARVCIAFFG